MNFNIEKMNREVYCSQCKKYSRTVIPAPHCPLCGYELLTVVRSIMTGERITGPEKPRMTLED